MNNVLLIITDDQRLEPDGDGNSTMDVMPNVQTYIADRGVTFANNYVTTPLCDPSRGSIYSGLLASEHGIIGNDKEANWDQTFSIQRILQDAGYRTGLIGKFTTGDGAVPGLYFEYVAETLQNAAELTSLIDYVNEFLTDPDPRPWFLVLSTNSPHRPYNLAAPGGVTIPTFVLPDSAAEADLTDKFQSVQNQAALWDPALAEEDFLGQLGELAAFDSVLPQVFSLFSDDELNDLLIVYTSDNGYEWGEHRLKVKDWPYVEDHHVPLIVSGPSLGFGEGTTDTRLVANIDIAPTVMDALDLSPDYRMTGFSLLTDSSREWLYTEIPDPEFVRYSRAYFALDRHYIQWLDGDGFIEDYDLDTDPTEEHASNVTDEDIESLLDGNAPAEPATRTASQVTVRPPTVCG